MDSRVDSADLEACRLVLRRFLRPGFVPRFLVGLDDEERFLRDVLLRSVRSHDNNSILIVGGPGSGKSALIHTAIRALRAMPTCAPFAVISLSGLFQTDGLSALQEIARQLCVLHAQPVPSPASYSGALSFVLQSLKAHPDPIFLILDHLELFVHETTRQTLLYSLLSATSDSSARVTVLGVTRRVDIERLLEKRVRSRFSSRRLHLFANPRDVEHVKQILRGRLLIPEEPLSGAADGFSAKELHAHSQLLGRNPFYVKSFNARTSALFRDSSSISAALSRIFAVTHNMFEFLNLAHAALSQLSLSSPFLDPDCLVRAETWADCSAACFDELTDAELSVLFCLAKLGEPVPLAPPHTFERIMAEYRAACVCYNVEISHPRIMEHSFNALCERELILFTDKSERTGTKFRSVRLAVHPDELRVGAYASHPMFQILQ